MRQLYIIGNGFDLAHNLKTRYTDFLDYYFQKSLHKARQASNKIYEDEMIRIKDLSYAVGAKLLDKSYKVILQNATTNTGIKIEIRNALIQNIIDTPNDRWVDIEMIYNTMLISYFKHFNTSNNNEFIKEALKTVDGLEYLKKELKQFIIEQIEPAIQDLSVPVKTSPFNVIFNKFNRNTDKILSFNYTSTPYLYVDKDSVIPIHDIASETIDKSGEPIDGRDIVFGFGDERSKYYQEIEDLNVNKLLNHSKSFGYFRNVNYMKLLDFLNQTGKYKVQIIGHSCGLSDRTLLSKIFEHARCISIEIHYYENFQRYLETTQEISRHFNDIDAMRLKLTKYPNCTPCPQLPRDY